MAINTAATIATRGAGQSKRAGDVAKGVAVGGLKGGTITAIATSGEVRQTAQDGVVSAEGFMKAFVGSEIERNEE